MNWFGRLFHFRKTCWSERQQISERCWPARPTASPPRCGTHYFCRNCPMGGRFSPDSGRHGYSVLEHHGIVVAAPPDSPQRQRRGAASPRAGHHGNLPLFARFIRRCLFRGTGPMLRFQTILALSAFCVLSDAASADQLNPRECSASEFSSRQRCECSTWYRPTRVVRYRHYRIGTAYLIGYDPLQYRFGSTFVWERPYRYYWR